MTEHHVEIEQYRLRVLKSISEGGFGIVYLVENENKQGPKMALKKIITQDAERYRIAFKELSFLKSYCSKPTNIFINYLASKIVEEQPQKYAFYILLEFCGNGTLFDLMASYMQKGQRFSEEEILVLLRSISSCLVALHSLGIIHCDFKIENLLFFNWEVIKLCDFGSVNNFNLDFSQIPKQQFYNFEGLFEKQTTLMYRPPEMCDLYLGYKVNNKVDMWMLGCVLFTLMFFKHPFNESSKLSIVSASYFWPEDYVYSEKLENL
ncbi:MAG: protein kinase, partial [Chitinophagaceae bacterium]|nr:protein kinase [Chitinophagaceae bacterium]